jgi:hypothetical protein
MTVLPDYGRAEDAEGLYVVVGENSNGEYLVDVRTGACECKDSEYRNPEGGCKHYRRIEFATAQRAIPGYVDREAVDDNLSVAVEATPRYAVADGGIIEADDDGEIIEDNNTDDVDDGEARPSDCNCGGWNAESGLSCWACYREGFRLPPADVGDE